MGDAAAAAVAVVDGEKPGAASPAASAGADKNAAAGGGEVGEHTEAAGGILLKDDADEGTEATGGALNDGADEGLAEPLRISAGNGDAGGDDEGGGGGGDGTCVHGDDGDGNGRGGGESAGLGRGALEAMPPDEDTAGHMTAELGGGAGTAVDLAGEDHVGGIEEAPAGEDEAE